MIAYLVTCSKSKFILNASLELWNRYTPFDIRVIDLGDEPVATWTHNVYRRLQNCKEKQVIFTLDDFLINSHLDLRVFERAMFYMDNTRIVRYELGEAFHKKKTYDIISHGEDYQVISLKHDNAYRLSCQPSVWDVQYLLKQLRHKGSPWNFETVISDRTKTDGMKMIGTLGKYALDYGERSALSKKWEGINYAGLSEENIIFVKEKLNILQQ